MPFLLTRKNVEELNVDAKVIGSCPYRSPRRNQGWQPDLWAEQRRIQALAPGESLLTSGTEFDAKCGIITLPPIWEGGERKEALKLSCCYDSALRLAHRRRCRSVAFPLLSADCHGFPKDLALRTAIATITDCLDKYEMTVYLSIREPSALAIFDKHYSDILRELEETLPTDFSEALECEFASASQDFPLPCAAPKAVPCEKKCAAVPVPQKLEALMAAQEETFSQQVMRYIDQKGLKDPEVYKKANLDRRLFSKIRSNANYQPSKTTALALALALELNLDQTRDLIGKAGYSLTRSNKADIILEYFIREGDYDLYEINQILFAFDQPLLGS